jgi:hypothetical protein
VWCVCDIIIMIPKVLTVRCLHKDCSPTIHSDNGTSTAETPPQAGIIKVATLSNFDIAVKSELVVARNDHNINIPPNRGNCPPFHYVVQAQNAQNLPPETPFSPTILMSTNNQMSSISTSNFAPIFRAACDEYKTLTGHDLYTHPFAKVLDRYDSADGILNVLREQAQMSFKCLKDHEKLLACLNPIVNVLFTFSATLGEGIGLVRISSLLHCCP